MFMPKGTFSEAESKMLEIRVQRYSLVYLKAIDYLSNLYHFSWLPGQIELFGHLICPQLCILQSHSLGSSQCTEGPKLIPTCPTFSHGSAGRVWTHCLPRAFVPRGPSLPGTQHFPRIHQGELMSTG